jgi:hypothetical protein
MLERAETEDCIATFWHQATPGTTFWRCLVPARHLPAQTLPFTPVDLKETKDGKPYLPRQKGDTAIWQFLGDQTRTRIALGVGEIHQYRTLMELDDNYTRPAPYQYGKKNAPWVNTIAEAKGGYSHEMHRAILPWMDGLIVSTDFLANVYEEYHDTIYVCPNSVDPDDWQYDREVHDAFRIVYYGSPSHTVDAPLVTDALKWASKQPGVEVWTVGFRNPAWSFPHQVIPWGNDLVEARKHLFKFDLGIAPLKTNAWANAKSDVKALEYTMAGVMPVVQKSEPFKAWEGIVPTPSTKGDWTEAIRWAVQNPDEVAGFARNAKEYVLRERTIQSNIHLWREAVNG